MLKVTLLQTWWNLDYWCSMSVIRLSRCSSALTIRRYLDLPSIDILDGIEYMMAVYYVLEVQYPRVCNLSKALDI